eukprot:1191791-Prorocentrum_minimum.AAC.3
MPALPAEPLRLVQAEVHTLRPEGGDGGIQHPLQQGECSGVVRGEHHVGRVAHARVRGPVQHLLQVAQQLRKQQANPLVGIRRPQFDS